jgi:hypothetical protein
MPAEAWPDPGLAFVNNAGNGGTASGRTGQGMNYRGGKGEIPF